MENMDKGLKVPKWVMIVRLKIPQMPQNFSAQFLCPSPKVWDFNEKELHWESVVRALGLQTSLLKKTSGKTDLLTSQGGQRNYEVYFLIPLQLHGILQLNKY